MKNPVRHFCEVGWPSLFNPDRDFDVWWYWVEHLDPTAERINPLLHYLLTGRQAGLPTLPPDRQERPATLFTPAAPVRRACLFAGYDPDGIIDDYVVDYITELSRHADVYYLADTTMAPSELAKLGVGHPGRVVHPPRPVRLRLVVDARARPGGLGHPVRVRRGGVRQRQRLSAATTGRAVRQDGRDPVRLVGAASDQTAVLPRRGGPVRCRWPRRWRGGLGPTS